MTTKMSVSVSDDVAAFLKAQPNASAVVDHAIRQLLPEARRARRRAAAQAYAEHLRSRGPEQVEADEVMQAHQDAMMAGHEW